MTSFGLAFKVLSFLAALFFATMGTAAPATAQDRGAAIQLITDANAAYEAGQFKDALGKYREAYDLTEDARILYRIGLTYEHLANYQRAREHLELFLLAEPSTPHADRVQKKIENLKTFEASLQSSIDVTTEPARADVFLDDEQGRPVGVSPVRIPVGPGTHVVIVKKEGFEPIRDEVVVDANQTVERAYQLAGPGTAEDPEPDVTSEPQTEEAPVTEPPPPAMVGATTRVRVGPSTGTAVVLWTAVAIGWAVLVIGGGLSGAGQSGIGGGGVLLGAAIGGIGGYFLFFHDWTGHLPPAPATATVPAGRGIGFGVSF